MKDHLFKPGQSGNPSGRPKTNKRIVELAQAQTESAIATLVGIMEDKGATPAARVSAASTILDRGWGRPPQEITGDDENPLHVVTQVLLRGVRADADASRDTDT
jgi:hypothetical protein